jgi:hypothetical protein
MFEMPELLQRLYEVLATSLLHLPPASIGTTAKPRGNKYLFSISTLREHHNFPGVFSQGKNTERFLGLLPCLLAIWAVAFITVGMVLLSVVA